MLDLLDGIRRNLEHWVNTTELLLSDASSGDTTLHVRSTKRFLPGEQFFIRNANEDVENFLTVDSIIDDTHLTITEPLTLNWTVDESASISRSFYGQFFRAIHLGEPDFIDAKELPCITVWGTSRNSEPLAIRTTKERYNIEISVFVADATLEDGVRLLLDSTDLIQRGLKRNLYPLVNDFETTVLTADAVVGDTYLKVPDSSVFENRRMLLLEDELDTQELVVFGIIDEETICVRPGAYKTYDKDDTTVIIPQRFIYNSWPADINYNKIHKGTLMKAAVINYFAEEAEDQFVSSWFDTQLK